MLETGGRGDYHWFVGRVVDGSLPGLVLSCHVGHRLGVSSFDSDRLRPNEEEVADGWTMRGDVAVSPPLAVDLYLPHAGFDEWYVFDEHSSPSWSPEVFVNFDGFTVVPVEELQKRRDPTWERDTLDWLVPIQERFWEQLERIRPISYIAMGQDDVIVTRSHPFAMMLRNAG